MRTELEVRKEIEEFEDKLSKLQKELYKITDKENKEITDKMIGKCFYVLGTGSCETYRILYKKARNGYYYFKDFTLYPICEGGYVRVDSFTENRTSNVIHYTKHNREIPLEEFKTKVTEMIDNYHSNWYEMMINHLNEVI